MIFALCILGMFPLLAALLPLPAIVPVLLFIGLVIGTQAFSAVPRAHYPAILLAVVPNIAAWGAGLVDNALVAAGTSAQKVGAESLNGAGVITEGLHTLGRGRCSPASFSAPSRSSSSTGASCTPRSPAAPARC